VPDVPLAVSQQLDELIDDPALLQRSEVLN
jgi:hypothetical protein